MRAVFMLLCFLAMLAATVSLFQNRIDWATYWLVFAVLFRVQAMDARQTVPQHIGTDTRAKRTEVKS